MIDAVQEIKAVAQAMRYEVHAENRPGVIEAFLNDLIRLYEGLRIVPP